MSEAEMHTVLVAEDEPDIRRLLEIMLTKAGFRAIIAADGQQAIDLFEAERPELVILDVAMPYLGGWDVLIHIRQTSEARVLMLSARGLETDQVRGLNLGADDYMTKPFNNADLITRVRSLLGLPAAVA
ncbi:MAG: response regulator transcription factor [Dehalococcoidia bacterium]